MINLYMIEWINYGQNCQFSAIWKLIDGVIDVES